MALFDVLKYPVTDIFDQSQLDPIPAPILECWIAEVFALIDSGVSPTIFAVGSISFYATFVNIVLMQEALDDDDLVDTLKEYYTNRLRHYIREYQETTPREENGPLPHGT